jgi:hypothetical protein
VGHGHTGFQHWVGLITVLHHRGAGAASSPWLCSMTDLGMVAQVDNGQGTRNECGVLTDDVQAADRGRRRGFVSAQRSGAVILGYRREGKGGATPLLGL